MPHPPSYLRTCAKAKKQPASSAPLEWLFALTAKHGMITESQGEYYLEISSQDVVKVVAFTDRPNRIVKTITASKLASQWSMPGTNSFEEDPPNASFASAGTPLDIIEILGTTSGNGKLSFRFKYLSTSQRSLGNVHDVVLTIDSKKQLADIREAFAATDNSRVKAAAIEKIEAHDRRDDDGSGSLMQDAFGN